MKKVLSIVLALFIFSASYAQKNIQDAVKTYKLKNGLTVYLIKDKTATDVFGYVVTKGGSKEDPKDAEGIAHYLEHMMFKGTEKIGTVNWEKEKPLIDKTYKLYEKLRSTDDEDEELRIQKEINDVSVKATEYLAQNDLDKILKEMGGTGVNANTNWDRTVYFNSFPVFQLEKWIDVYSERFMNPVFRGFQAELEVVFEEKNMSLDNRGRRTFEALLSKIYGGHEYSRTVLGRVEHIKKPSLNKMKKFFDTYYVPNNMCLIIAGNIDVAKTEELVEAKFGRWKAVELPAEKVAAVKPFDGHEVLKVKLGRSRSGSIVYRTVPSNHEDTYALSFVSYLLSNGSSTGAFDKLRIDNEIDGARASAWSLNDHGVFMIDYSPKVNMEKAKADWERTGRYRPAYESFSSAEKVLLKEVKKIKNGEIAEWKIEAAKKAFINSFAASTESAHSLSLKIGEAFQSGESLDDLFSYSKKINAITKDDIVRVAKKYLGKNYLSFNVYEGKPENKKIDKPAFEPIEPKVGNISEYSKKVAAMPVVTPEPMFVDYKNDFKEEEIKKGVDLYYSKNPKNNIFSLTIKYGVGNKTMPNLKYASQLMNYSGTLKRDINALKEEFAKISCNYGIYSTDNNLVVSVSGEETYLAEALKLMTELLLVPKLDEDKLELILRSQMGSRYYEKKNADNVFAALKEYVLYGKESRFLDRKDVKEINKLVVSKLVNVYQNATNYEVEMHYCGSKDFAEAKKVISDNLNFKSNLLKKKKDFARDKQQLDKEQIYFVQDKDAVQSKVFLFVNGEKFTKEDFAADQAFNYYYAGGFSGIVMQEIREKRSLAYGAGASYGPSLPGKDAAFYASTTTQNDKTAQAVKVFMDIIKDMPEKAERMDNIKSYLVQSSMVSKPGFRSITQAVASWKKWGINEDPSKSSIEKFKSMSFGDIVNFYKKNIKNKPISICILGNKKKIDMKSLKKMAKIVTISKSKLFSKD